MSTAICVNRLVFPETRDRSCAPSYCEFRSQDLRAVAFDFGHTLVDERVDILQSTVHNETQLMPGAQEALTTLKIPIAIWANTRVARAEDIDRGWCERTSRRSFAG